MFNLSSKLASEIEVFETLRDLAQLVRSWACLSVRVLQASGSLKAQLVRSWACLPVWVSQTSGSLEACMIVNFRVRRINRGMLKLACISTLIKNKKKGEEVDWSVGLRRILHDHLLNKFKISKIISSNSGIKVYELWQGMMDWIHMPRRKSQILA